MENFESSKKLSRRDFLKLGGGLVAGVAGAGVIRALLKPDQIVAAGRDFTGRLAGQAVSQAAPTGSPTAQLHFAATDGFMYMDAPSGFTLKAAGNYAYWPDDLAPGLLNTYVFGFRNVTGLSNDLVYAQKNRAEICAPLWYMDEGRRDPVSGAWSKEYWVKLTNLGLQIRPDLVDSHSLHFHGFKNAIPMFDGEPASTISVPINRDFTYVYHPAAPGTYMYHCHFEDVEHVHMGMTGPVHIRPLQNATGFGGDPNTISRLPAFGGPASAPMGYVYNDGDGSTAYDREFTMFLSEVWAYQHWTDSHIQLAEWSEYNPDFFLLNGRVYPDTLAGPGRGNDPLTGDAIPPDPGGNPLRGIPAGDYSRLQYQQLSALVTCKPGERVLLRFASLGYRFATMTLPGIRMRVVGRDAEMLRGRDGSTDNRYFTNSISVGPGEAVESIFTAPAFDAAAAIGTAPNRYNRYLLYNRDYRNLGNAGQPGPGGQMTEVRVFEPASGLNPQLEPNT